jgi:hypothetical protein
LYGAWCENLQPPGSQHPEDQGCHPDDDKHGRQSQGGGQANPKLEPENHRQDGGERGIKLVLRFIRPIHA